MIGLRRRGVRSASVAIAVLLAFGGGVVTGVVGTQADPPEETGVIAEAADEISRNSARPITREQLEQAAISGMLRALDDQWSRYYTADQYESFRSRLAGRYSGVGVWLVAPTGRVEVSAVQPGSPAARAGLMPADRLVRVGGHPVSGSVSDALARLGGRAGTGITVTVSRDGERRHLYLSREDFRTPDVSVRQLNGDVLLLDIAEFTRGVGRKVRQTVTADPARHSGGVILDLRGNRGGLLGEAVETASVFLDGGPVVSYERPRDGRRVLHAVGDGDTSTPLVVLVNGSSASAAEVVAGALQDRNRGVIVGAHTYGKGAVQQAFQLHDGSAVKVTVGRYYTPSGRSLSERGVVPDVYIDPGGDSEVAKRRALDILSGLLAALPGGKGHG